MEHLATDILAGMYRSAFKGKGMEFEEVREYIQGDDVRSIDWNVTARMNHPYVKTFREERELTVMLLVDISSSLRFGTQNTLKRDMAAEIAAVLAFSGIKNQDKIGLILFSDEVEKYLPPKKGIRHVLRIIRDLMVVAPEKKGTDIAKALAFLGKVQKRSCVVFLLSDFISKDFFHEASIIAEKNDLIAIQFLDPLEVSFPDIGLVNLQALEGSETGLFDTSNLAFRKLIKDTTLQRLETCKRKLKESKASWIEVRTDKPYMLALRKFFKERERRFK